MDPLRALEGQPLIITIARHRDENVVRVENNTTLLTTRGFPPYYLSLLRSFRILYIPKK